MRQLLFPILASLLVTFTLPAEAGQARAFPARIMVQAGGILKQVGSGQYSKLGFNIYNASLWAPGGSYHKDKPYALRLHYTHGLSKETVVEAVVGDVRKQQLADATTMNAWQKLLTRTLPAVKDGDEIIGLHVPGKPTKLFFNRKQIASIADKRLSDSFFNIWLGEIANQPLRAKLLNI